MSLHFFDASRRSPAAKPRSRQPATKANAVRTAHRLFACCLVASAAAASAAVVPWLYTAEVPVRTQSASEREQAAAAALAELLTRATGLAPLPSSGVVAEALASPGPFYDRYEYARPRAHGGAGAPPLLVVFHFDPASVLALLREAELPVWAADRPSVLAWVAVEQHGERRMAAAAGGEGAALAAALAVRARQRGLELTLPLMDLADSTLTPAALWGLFWEDIDAASARYAPDLLLVGRVRNVGGGLWRSVWDLRSRGSAAPVRLYDLPVATRTGRRIRRGEALLDAFRHDAPTLAEIAAAAVDSMAATLADRFAVRGQLAAIDAVVRAAQTVERYAALLAYLQSREYIERVEVRAVMAEALVLRLHSRSSPAQLRDLLGIGDVLAAAPADAAQSGALALVWRGGP